MSGEGWRIGSSLRLPGCREKLLCTQAALVKRIQSPPESPGTWSSPSGASPWCWNLSCLHLSPSILMQSMKQPLGRATMVLLQGNTSSFSHRSNSCYCGQSFPGCSLRRVQVHKSGIKPGHQSHPHSDISIGLCFTALILSSLANFVEMLLFSRQNVK